jgi:alpha-aminoadipate carrier protein LysW
MWEDRSQEQIPPLTCGPFSPETGNVVTSGRAILQNPNALESEEAAMPTCPECENELDVELDEVEEGDVLACDECGTEYEVVGVEPLELSRVDGDLDEDEDELLDEDEEEE